MGLDVTCQNSVYFPWGLMVYLLSERFIQLLWVLNHDMFKTVFVLFTTESL